MHQLGASLRFLASRGREGGRNTVSQLIDLLRRYKQPTKRATAPTVPICELVRPDYVSSTGNLEIADLMQLYGEVEVPVTRVKRWEEFMSGI